VLGGIVWKGITFGLIAMLTLTVGTELLASAVSISTSARHGNPVPLLMVFIATLVLSQLLRHHKTRSLSRSFLMVLTYGSIAYATLLSFVAVLPWGVYSSLISASVTILLFTVAVTPQRLELYHSQARLHSLASRMGNQSGGTTTSAIGALSNDMVQQAKVIVLQEEDRDRVIQLMKDRPLLPISLTRLADCYALVVTTPEESEIVFHRVVETLSEYGISHLKRARPLLTEAILMLPMIDESYGLLMRDYRLVRDETAMTHVMSQWPERLTVFPTKDGLRAVVPEQAVTGLNTQQIPHGLEAEIILFRNHSSIQGDDETASEVA